LRPFVSVNKEFRIFCCFGYYKNYSKYSYTYAYDAYVEHDTQSHQLIVLGSALSTWGVVLYLILEVCWCALLYEPGVKALLGVAGQGGVVQRAPTLPVLAPQVPLPTLGNILTFFTLRQGLRHEMNIF
jgi:hypothetical protein